MKGAHRETRRKGKEERERGEKGGRGFFHQLHASKVTRLLEL